MSVLEELLSEAQPGYFDPVKEILLRLLQHFGEAAFEGVEKADVVPHVVALAADSDLTADARLQLISDLSSLAWWCGVEISDEGCAAMGQLARRTYFDAAKSISARIDRADPAAQVAHTVFVGPVVNVLHSPTRGAFDYIRALAADVAVVSIDVFYSGALTPEIKAYGDERLGPCAAKVRFHAMDADPNFLLKAIGEGPRTFHIWCEQAFSPHLSLLSIFGPTVMFTCGDAAPVQFADAYWYCHEASYIQRLWRRRGTPETFTANYRQLESAPFNQPLAQRKRTRAELGFREDDVVIVSAGNRLGVDFDQTFVDGIAGLVLANPNCRWLVVGALQDFWVGAFSQVLGDQFSHVAFDPDLAGLLSATDIFANPFRAGGGNTAIMAICAGAVVLTRGDLGDVGAFVPAAHRAPDAQGYFEQLSALVTDPALLAAQRAEQQALLAKRLDQDLFASELKAISQLAYKRFAARLPTNMKAIYAQGLSQRLAVSSRAERPSRSPQPHRSRPR